MADDPRDIITEQAFRVQPALLGTPLATPTRRLIAVSIDAVLASVLSKLLGTALVFFLAVSFFRSARRTNIRGILSRGRRWALYLAAAVCLLGALAALLDSRWFRSSSDEGVDRERGSERVSTATASEGGGGEAPVSEDVESVRRVIELIIPFVPDEVRTEMEQDLADTLERQSSTSSRTEPRDVETARKIVNSVKPYVGEELQAKLTARLEEIEAAALTASTATGTARVPPPPRCPEPRACPEPEPWTAASVFTIIFETLGLTFGWFGFYFTVAHFYGRGRSPGKRLLGLRVLRLDGRPLRLWDCFERFSGFGAGVATGLLGFAQIYWDANRQALHDKIVSTVVIDERPKKS